MLGFVGLHGLAEHRVHPAEEVRIAGSKRMCSFTERLSLMPLQVEQQNAAILAEGGRKLEVLRAIKDFKKGIYGLQWEHKRSKLEV